MHSIEPYYNWRQHYVASEDPQSPFFNREYDEFRFTHAIYDHLIHPQWDFFGSPTLFIKILFADYDEGFAVIEMIGEWNDCLHNDIMMLKREIIEHLMLNGINKFVLIGENVLNFHGSDECYYEEWFDEVEDSEGWIAMLNFRDHVLEEFQHQNIDSYFIMGGTINEFAWRTQVPQNLCSLVSKLVQRRLGPLV